MKIGDCSKCYSGTMVKIKTVKRYDGVFTVYQCNNCGHKTDKKEDEK